MDYLYRYEHYKNIAIQFLKAIPLVYVNLIHGSSQPTHPTGLVGLFNPTTVGVINPMPRCPALGIALFCKETVPNAGRGFKMPTPCVENEAI